MKFLILGFTPADSWDAATADSASEEALAAFAEYQRFEAELRATGEFVSAEGLGHPSRSATVQRRDGEVVVTDGPFAELKEVLASFAILDVENLDRAKEIVSRMVAVLGEPMEIRPIMGPEFTA